MLEVTERARVTFLEHGGADHPAMVQRAERRRRRRQQQRRRTRRKGVRHFVWKDEKHTGARAIREERTMHSNDSRKKKPRPLQKETKARNTGARFLGDAGAAATATSMASQALEAREA